MNNKYFKSIVSVLLVVSILFSFSFAFTAFAESQRGVISKDAIRVRTSPTTNSSENILKHNGANILLNTGDTVTVLETVNSPDDKQYPTWCHIEFKYSGKDYEGYVYSGFVQIKSTDTPGGVMPEGVPEIYKEYIAELVKYHPNWKFVFYDTGIEWSSLFTDDAQGYVGRSLIYKSEPLSYRSTQAGAYNWRTDGWISLDGGGWYQANAQTIAYYMDPRNFLNEKNIFMFESFKYDPDYHNISGVQTILKNSFMDGVQISKNGNGTVTYAQAYMDAAEESNVSPYHLTIRTLQEVGANGSGSTSGTYSGYVGYYNFYNINASSGSNPIANGLRYASGATASASEKEKYDLPWNNQYKAIVGGAKWIGEGYINKNQDTIYYQKFNVINKVWTHQYMTSIVAPSVESASIYKSYNNIGIVDESFVFSIPYYRNMPSKPCSLPEANNYSPNNWLKSLSIEGYSLDFDGGKTTGYRITVPSSVNSVKISATAVSSKAKINGTGSVSLKSGSNIIDVVVTAENGDKRTYKIEVLRDTSNDVPLKGISLNKTEISMFNGDTQTLTVSYNPSNTTDSRLVTWSSSDKSVVTVKDGEITAIGKGTATITAKVGEYTATCKIIVSNKVINGDVDADGVVSISDALMIFKYKSGEVKLSDTALKAADVDGNEKVEITDALRIYKYINGDISSL